MLNVILIVKSHKAFKRLSERFITYDIVKEKKKHEEKQLMMKT